MPKIIYLIILYPFLLILNEHLMYSLRNEKETCFNMIIPKWLRKDTRLQHILINYKKRVRRNIFLCALFSIVVVITPSPSFSLTTLYLWLILTVLASLIPYGRANTEIRQLLVQIQFEQRDLPIPDSNDRKESLHPRLFWTVSFATVLVTVYSFVYIFLQRRDHKNCNNILIVILLLAFFNVFLLYFWYKSEHRKPYLLCTDQKTNHELAQITKRCWRICFCILVCMNIVITYIVSFFFQNLINHHKVFLLSTYLYLFFCHIIMERFVRIIQRKEKIIFERPDIEPPYSAENNKWIWGIYYYAPKDRRIFIRSRFITGFSLNYGKKLAKVISYLDGFIILSGLFICIWSLFLECTPISLSINNENQIVATQLRDEYIIPMEEIKSVALLEELPIQLLSKNFASVSKGHYDVKEYGICSVFINPENTFYVYLQTKDEGQYIFSSYDDETTLYFYDQLINIFYS